MAPERSGSFVGDLYLDMPIFDPDQLRTLAASYSALQRRLILVA